MKLRNGKSHIVIGTALALGVPATGAWAADFYKGKDLTIIVSGRPAGTYDTYARLVAKRYNHHIPGKPAIIVKNMQGAGGIKAANYMYNVAPRDGTSINAASSAISILPLTRRKAAKFDANKLSWIGSVSNTTRIGFVWHTSPLKTLEDGRKMQIPMGGTSVGAGSVDLVIIANELFGFKFKLVSGYHGSPQVKLAMERGEVQGTFGNQFLSLKTTTPEWLSQGKVRIITQFGLRKDPELPDVPLFMDLAKTEADRQLLEFMLARQETAAPYFAPPAIPADRLAVLRRAFDATVKDPEFVAYVNKAHLEVSGPMTGEEVAALTAKLSKTPQSVLNRIEKIFASYRTKKKKK